MAGTSVVWAAAQAPWQELLLAALLIIKCMIFAVWRQCANSGLKIRENLALLPMRSKKFRGDTSEFRNSDVC